jgi:hypothetical protein
MEMKIVLAMIIKSFKLEPADCADNIYWEMSPVASPIVKDSAEKRHQMPVKVSLIAKDD